jgi:hypothetical protein
VEVSNKRRRRKDRHLRTSDFERKKADLSEKLKNGKKVETSGKR